MQKADLIRENKLRADQRSKIKAGADPSGKHHFSGRIPKFVTRAWSKLREARQPLTTTCKNETE